MAAKRGKVAKRTHSTRRKQLEQGARRTNRKARSNMSAFSGYNWHVAFVMSQKEYIAQKILTSWGASVYLPLARKLRLVNRYEKLRKNFAYPAIPGVVLIGTYGEIDWYDLFKLRVVYAVLGLNGEPVTIPGPRLRKFLTDNSKTFGMSLEGEVDLSDFTVGDSVEITDGPLEGHIIDVRDIRGDHAYFITELFGGEQEAKIALDKLQKVA
jgi:transcription antitermination factor NusG